MSITRKQVAKDVRVRLNDSFIEASLSRKYLKDLETEIYITYGDIYTDAKGDWVWVHGGSGTNSSEVYLSELDLDLREPTQEVITAFNRVRELYPELSLVVFNRQGQWRYCDEDLNPLMFEDEDYLYVTEFENKADKTLMDLLEAASDSLNCMPLVYQPITK